MSALIFDDELVEQVVENEIQLRLAHGSSELYDEFHRLADSAYGAFLSPTDRVEAIRNISRYIFRRFPHADAAAGALAHFPVLAAAAARIRFIRSYRDEVGDIVSANDGFEGIVSVRPETVVNAAAFRLFLLSEFLHMQDIVDPKFKFDKLVDSANDTPIRMRYRLLWNIYCDARLTRSGLIAQFPDYRKREFDSMYATIDGATRERIFEKLRRKTDLTHLEIWRLAKDTSYMLKLFGERSDANSCEVVPGSKCPLCAFPTYDWARLGADSPAADLLKREYPGISAAAVCSRCFELYEIKAQCKI